jgi:hypothetical protein
LVYHYREEDPAWRTKEKIRVSAGVREEGEVE